MKTDAELERASQEFAEELTSTVHAVAPDCEVFKARSVEGGKRFTVKQQPETGIPLLVNGEPLLMLKVNYRCAWDGEGTFMAIDKSSIGVFAAASEKQPLFRYEYERNASTVPSAHIHIHAHRDAFTYVMARSGHGTRRGAARAQGSSVPVMQEIHFPVGGHRFRPCLEDVLEMLLDEFGVDGARDARVELKKGRMRWRQTQTKSVVRDDPQSAIAALEDLGYDVTLRDGEAEPAVRTDRLTSQ